MTLELLPPPATLTDPEEFAAPWSGAWGMPNGDGHLPTRPGKSGHTSFLAGTVINSTQNPSIETNLTGWNLFSSSGTPALTRVADAGAGSSFAADGTVTLTAGGSLLIYPGSAASMVRYYGGEVFIRAKGKVQASTATVTLLRVQLRGHNLADNTVTMESHANIATAVQNTPVTGTWYDLFAVIPQSFIPAATAWVGTEFILQTSNAGSVSLRMDHVMCVLGQTVPVAFFDGNSTNAAWFGVANNSASAMLRDETWTQAPADWTVPYGGFAYFDSSNAGDVVAPSRRYARY